MSSSILNEQLFASFAASIRDINNAEMLPPICYTDAEFHEFEKDAIFNHEWLCVGRKSSAREPANSSPRRTPVSRSSWSAIGMAC